MALFPPEKGLPVEDYRPYLCTATEIEASYARYCSPRVPPDLARPRHVLPLDELALRLGAGALLTTFADRIITPVCCAGPQRQYIYILCDPELVALKIFAAPEVLAAAERVGVKPGTIFTEESCGTNALALAQEHQRLVAIRGEAFQRLVVRRQPGEGPCRQSLRLSRHLDARREGTRPGRGALADVG